MSQSEEENPKAKFKGALERKNLNSQYEKKNFSRIDKGRQESRGNTLRFFRRKSG